MLRKLQNLLAEFKSEQRGTLSVEAVLIFPLLVWASVATYSFFDAYKAQNATNRANYTVGDILSRQTTEVNQDYLDSMQNLFQYMTRAQTAGTWLRVSVIRCQSSCDKANRKLALDWSNSTNGARTLDAKDFAFYDEFVPTLPKGDRLILVETSMDYSPPFGNLVPNFSDQKLVSHSVTRPRFAPQLLWSNS